MARTARKACLLIALAAMGVVAVLLVRHRPPPSPPIRAKSPSDVRLRLEQIEVRGRKSGEKDWDLRAESVEVPRRGGPTVLRKVSEAVLYQEGEPYLTLRADEIRVDEATRELSVHGGLAAQMGERVRFSSPGAEWDPKQRRLTCRGPVELRLGQTVMTTAEMICDPERGEFIFPEGARVTAGRSAMRADRMVASVDSEVLELAGNVRARFWVDELDRIMAEDQLDRELLERVRAILNRLSTRSR